RPRRDGGSRGGSAPCRRPGRGRPPRRPGSARAPGRRRAPRRVRWTDVPRLPPRMDHTPRRVPAEAASVLGRGVLLGRAFVVRLRALQLVHPRAGRVRGRGAGVLAGGGVRPALVPAALPPARDALDDGILRVVILLERVPPPLAREAGRLPPHAVDPAPAGDK